MSKWKARARSVMARVMAEHIGDPPDKVLAAIDAAYPFGPRSHHPYKCWLAERKLVRELLARNADSGPLSKRCPACGVGPGRDCIDYQSRGDNYVFGPPMDGDLGQFHASRVNPPSGPLFGETE
jgi:hypothetical protein